MTTSDPTPTTDNRGKHARSDEPEEVEAAEERPAPEKRRRLRLGDGQPIGRHPAGNSLLPSAGLLLGLFLAPALLGRLDFDVFERAARAARSAATRWPGGGEPWFWPNWVAVLAGIVAVLLIGVAVAGVRLPDPVVAVIAVVLVVTTARAAWSTLAVVNARLWDLVPVALICLLAFGLAVSGLAHWRAPEDGGQSSGIGAAASAVVAGVVVALLLLAGGAGIARFQEEGSGPAGPPENVAGLLSIRAADVAEADDLGGSWVPQVAAEQIGDDEAATRFSARHRDWTAFFPVLLLRGDDLTTADLADTWWVTVAAQGFGSEGEVQQWCTDSGLAASECIPQRLRD
ncbi:hypothetical protein [Candidatus Blastococcus massiliensis]|uniref:hypothetical protein n=1 Tax=Candidatus Blastococcus massiliensis TaxID=1470358 RepID=UPI0004AE836F|nr:hypothetical protein [Candidatus Blastococcus massiliensis]